MAERGICADCSQWTFRPASTEDLPLQHFYGMFPWVFTGQIGMSGMVRSQIVLARLSCEKSRLTEREEDLHCTLDRNRSARTESANPDDKDAWIRSRFEEEDNPAEYGRRAGVCFNPKGFTPTQIFLLSRQYSVIGSMEMDNKFGLRDDQHALMDQFRQDHPEVNSIEDQR